MDGFDLSTPLICEGIIGDGCGGGRYFMVENETLFAYDPQSKEHIVLLKNIKKAKNVSKKSCMITIICENEIIKFDLSEFTG